MEIQCIFSRNKQIGSRLISWASSLLVKDLDKTPSHVAILTSLPGVEEKFIIESVLFQGVRIIPYSTWLTKNEVCYSIEKSILSKEIINILHKYWGKKYDTPGIVYFSYCFLRYYIFRTKFPKNNKWKSSKRYFCTELAAQLIGYGKASMTTPAKMCSDLLKDS